MLTCTHARAHTHVHVYCTYIQTYTQAHAQVWVQGSVYHLPLSAKPCVKCDIIRSPFFATVYQQRQWGHRSNLSCLDQRCHVTGWRVFATSVYVQKVLRPLQEHQPSRILFSGSVAYAGIRWITSERCCYILRILLLTFLPKQTSDKLAVPVVPFCRWFVVVCWRTSQLFRRMVPDNVDDQCQFYHIWHVFV